MAEQIGAGKSFCADADGDRQAMKTNATIATANSVERRELSVLPRLFKQSDASNSAAANGVAVRSGRISSFRGDGFNTVSPRPEKRILLVWEITAVWKWIVLMKNAGHPNDRARFRSPPPNQDCEVPGKADASIEFDVVLRAQPRT
jgi:hypothetical protein